MKYFKIKSDIVILISVVSILYGCVCENDEPEIILGEIETEASDANLKILAIGNSFTDNATMYMPDILANRYRNKEVFFSKVTIGGSSLEDHWNNYKSNLSLYTLSWTNGGVWHENESLITLDQTLNITDWDIIVIQQVSGLSGYAESFDPYIEKLSELFRARCKSSEIGWQMTWSYSDKSNHVDFNLYGNDRKRMYESIENALINVKPYTDFIIPSGYLIEQLRNTEFNTPWDLTKDGYHLESGLPCYALSCLWHEILVKPYFGISCLENNLHPNGIIDVSDKAFELISKIIETSLDRY